MGMGREVGKPKSSSFLCLVQDHFIVLVETQKEVCKMVKG